MAHRRRKIIDLGSAILLLALFTLDATIGSTIVMSIHGNADRTGIYFLPVSQGESALLVLPGGVTVLTDAGPDDGIVEDLQKVLPSGGVPYIDLAIISYAESADYTGYEYLLEHDAVGAFLYNGRSDDVHPDEWAMLMAAIAAKHIPLITIGAGDSIHCGAFGEIDILSPDNAFARSPAPADTGIVQRIITPEFTALLAADIGPNVENALLARGNGVQAGILKAPFPGLATAAGDPFLHAVAPRVIVVTPGVKNTLSVPTKAMLTRLASITSATITVAGRGSFLLYNE